MRTRTRELLKHDLLWGVGLGTTVVIFTQVLTWTGLGLSHWTWISTYVLVVVFTVLGGRSLSKRLAAAPSFARAAVLVVLMFLVSRVMYQTYMFFYLTFVDPTWVDTVAEVWEPQLREAGSSEEKISRTVAAFRNHWETGNIFSLGIIQYHVQELVLGIVTVTVAAVRPWRRNSS